MAKPRHKRTPAHQGNGTGNGGSVPPVQYRFKPGQSGNPAGRPSAGAAIKEWLYIMAEWTEKELKAVIADENSTASKKTAARVWLHATTMDLNSAGSPIAGAEFDRILDRTLGKPAQAVDITSNGESIYLKDVRGVSVDDL
jgi:hypothetical protein